MGREGRGREIPVSNVVSPPYTNSVCVGMEWKCPVRRAKGVFLLPSCVCLWWPSLLSTSGRSIMMCTLVWWRGVLWKQRASVDNDVTGA